VVRTVIPATQGFAISDIPFEHIEKSIANHSRGRRGPCFETPDPGIPTDIIRLYVWTMELLYIAFGWGQRLHVDVAKRALCYHNDGFGLR